MDISRSCIDIWNKAEKQRILRENSGRSLNPGNECNKDIQASTITKLEVLHDIITKSASAKGNDKPRLAMLKLENEDNHKNSNSKSKKIASNTSITAEVTGDLKKPSRPTSFFDRFRQGCNIDSKNHVSNLQKAATAERGSRPFLFKYNEYKYLYRSSRMILRSAGMISSTYHIDRLVLHWTMGGDLHIVPKTSQDVQDDHLG
ncbi:hypothetical protein MA16_Dca008887 [Dendrobium catenatum]|uniref:Uncharacterized protein n=1 Tax=Dendrobium catenatum TaxID=906689 RepID=A0A2I0VUJ8_9ASPA|nr:hypothetical protein MA16_Dca008887 [Dendrobium catenatum]